jgi:hypothetical protein
MLPESKKHQIIQKLVIEHKKIAIKSGYYSKEREIEFNNKINECNGIFELCVVFQKFSAVPLSVILDDLIGPILYNTWIKN